MKQYESALDDYNKAISLDSEYGYAFLNRGITKEMMRDAAGACEDWKKAASLGINNAETYSVNCK